LVRLVTLDGAGFSYRDGRARDGRAIVRRPRLRWSWLIPVVILTVGLGVLVRYTDEYYHSYPPLPLDVTLWALLIVAGGCGAVAIYPWIDGLFQQGHRKGNTSSALAGYVIIRSMPPGLVVLGLPAWVLSQLAQRFDDGSVADPVGLVFSVFVGFCIVFLLAWSGAAMVSIFRLARRTAGSFQDHDVRLRILKDRSMKRVAHLVVSVTSRLPSRWIAPTARLRRAAMTRGPEPVRAVELSSR
jgi:hypothetical protein